MSNTFFKFKQFTIHQDRSAMKVTTDACLFGAWVAREVGSHESGVRRRLLDIGTGTGLLALMIAQKFQNSRVEGIEIDKDAFEQASENVLSSPWADRVRIINDDVLNFEPDEKYDVIISNPPFYEKELKGNDEKKNIAHHNEGLLLPELLNQIKKLLKPVGRFYLLLPYKRNEEIRKMLTGHELGINKIVMVRQSDKHDYFRMMLEGELNNNEQVETEIEEIAICHEAQKYTPAFTQLLEEYYLYL